MTSSFIRVGHLVTPSSCHLVRRCGGSMATIAPRPLTRRRSIVGEVLFWLALAIAFIFFMFPLFWLLITSLKQRSEVTLLPPTFVPFVDFQPTTINYLAVFTKVSELGTVTAGSQPNTEISTF